MSCCLTCATKRSRRHRGAVGGPRLATRACPRVLRTARMSPPCPSTQRMTPAPARAAARAPRHLPLTGRVAAATTPHVPAATRTMTRTRRTMTTRKRSKHLSPAHPSARALPRASAANAVESSACCDASEQKITSPTMASHEIPGGRGAARFEQASVLIRHIPVALPVYHFCHPGMPS